MKIVNKAILAMAAFATVISTVSCEGGQKSTIQFHKKKLDTQNEKSTIMESYHSGELRKKRDYSWKEYVQLIVHLTDISYLPQLLNVCETEKTQYIPENSYAILCPIDSIPTISTLSFVDFFDRFSSEYKTPIEQVKGVEKQGKEMFTLTLTPGSGDTKEELEEIINILETTLSSFGLLIFEKSSNVIVLGVDPQFSKDLVRIASDFEFCHFIEAKRKAKVNNEQGRWITMTGTENDYSPETKGITGKNVIVGEVDTGLDLNHCYFYDSSTTIQMCTSGNPSATQCTTPNNNHRKVVGYYAYSDSTDYSGHGTHVAGTIGGYPFTTATGDVATHIGVAKDAKLALFDVEQSGSDGLDIPSLSTTVFPYLKTMGAKIASNSWGFTGDTGVYGTTSAEVDSFTSANPEFFVLFAAGNDGQTYGSASSIGNAKNCVSVGSLVKLPAIEVSSFSGAGFTPEKRIKPDIVTPGSNIISAKYNPSYSGGPSCSDSSVLLTDMSGTSMATPNAAGAAALITQYYKDGFICNQQASCKLSNPSGALIKATLINSAQHFYESWYKGAGIEFTGFGRVKLSDVFDYDGSKLVYFDKISITQGKNYSTNVTPTGKGSLNIVLTWYEPAGSPSASISPMNNLDLIVTSPSGKVYYGNEYLGIYSQQKDNLNTVERILIPQIDIESGSYSVVVNALTISQGSSQLFSLVINKESSSECSRCGKLRLTNGASGKEGRLEMLKNGQWWNVCSSSINRLSAQSICTHLGFPKSPKHFIYKNNKHGQGNLNIWNRDISCTGSESNFFDCTFGKTSNSGCNHLNDIGVSCDCPSPHVWDGTKCVISYCETGGKTFSSGSVNAAIPDNPTTQTPASSTVSVSGISTSVTSANFSLIIKTTIAHTSSSDLITVLFPPSGKNGIYLQASQGFSYQNVYNGVTWRDDAFNMVKTYRYSANGAVSPMAPYDSLNVLLDKTPDPNGKWYLDVYDLTSGNTGTLSSWSVTILGGCNCVRGKCDPSGCNSCDCFGTGYTGTSCTTDLNECDFNPCSPSASCTNSNGGYTCTCNAGYSGDGFLCSQTGLCAVNNGNCSANANCIPNTDTRTCTCKTGYSGDGFTCTDVNECSTNNGGCDPKADCLNTPGSFVCKCTAGYEGTGFTCSDVNECLTNNGGCDSNADCTNTVGSRTCACKSGFTGDGMTCSDSNDSILRSPSFFLQSVLVFLSFALALSFF